MVPYKTFLVPEPFPLLASKRNGRDSLSRGSMENAISVYVYVTALGGCEICPRNFATNRAIKD